MRNRRNLVLCCCLGMLGLATPATSSEMGAANLEFYTLGAACQAANTWDPGRLERSTTYGYIYNDDPTNNATVVCPIQTVEADFGSGTANGSVGHQTGSDEFEIGVGNGHASETVSCTVRRHYWTYGANLPVYVDFESDSTAAADTSDLQYFLFEASSSPGTNRRYAYHATCSLPENDGTSARIYGIRFVSYPS